MGLDIKGGTASLLIWVLLSGVFFFSCIGLYKITTSVPATVAAKRIERTMDYLLPKLQSEMQWSIQAVLNGSQDLPLYVDAVLLTQHDNVVAFRSNQEQSALEQELLPSMLGLLQTTQSMSAGIAYWRDRTFLVAIGEQAEKRVLAAIRMDTWLAEINQQLAMDLQLVATDRSTGKAAESTISRTLPTISGGSVQLVASARESANLQSFPWAWAILISVLISASLVWLMYYRPMWGRIRILLAQCRAVMSSGDYRGRIKLSGKDELSELAVQLNSVFSSLEYCYNLMAKTNLVTTELLQKVDQYSLADQNTAMSEAGELKASLDTVSRLSTALDTGHLETCVQPVFASDKQVIRSYEVATRWLDNELGVLPVVDFVPLCESAGLVKKLTKVMITEALSALRQLQVKGGESIKVSLKLGAAQFTRSVLIEVLSQFSDADRLLLKNIEFEIKESALTHDFDTAEATIAELKTLGAGICISDFGMSRYSLMYLQRIPVDRIKLAPTFTQQVVEESRARAFIEGVARFASGLGITVVVQNMEPDQQLQGLSADLPIEYQDKVLSAMVPIEIALAS